MTDLRSSTSQKTVEEETAQRDSSNQQDGEPSTTARYSARSDGGGPEELDWAPGRFWPAADRIEDGLMMRLSRLTGHQYRRQQERLRKLGLARFVGKQPPLRYKPDEAPRS